MLPRYTRNQIRMRGVGRRPLPLRNRKKKKVLLALVGGIVLIGIIILVGAFLWLGSGLPDPTKGSSGKTPVSTKIYDRTGEHLLFEIFKEERRTPITLAELPEHVKWATIVIEDKSFYKHAGFNIRGIIRALVKDIFAGGKVQGGSSITQQYIKNALLSPEKTITRKLKELVYAYKIEKQFSKDQILELYFNQIPYGGTAYGIEAAAQTFFGKHANEATVGEAAVLAALPQAPSYYSPYGGHKDILLGRAQYILKLMLEEGYLSQEAFNKAKDEKIEFKPFTDSIQAPHFVMYIRELIAEKYGEKTLQEGGLRVITALDYSKQKTAERVVKEGAERNAKISQAKNAALVSMDPKTGEILTMVGSKDYFDTSIDGNVNVALRPRQPGSSFKPIVYATAFSKGYSPQTLLFDLETSFPAFQGPYQPKNYDGKTRGPVSLRAALAGSLNIPSVKLLYLAGINSVLDLAESLGYSTFPDRSRFGLSLVLGGGEVKLLEHVRAFSAFARDGILPQTHAILKITDRDGNTLEEYRPSEGKKVIEPSIVRKVNSILSDVEARKFIFGSTPYLTLAGRPVAVKTGTTNNYRDAWTIGYTPSLVTGVWVGNNDNTEMVKGGAAAMVAAPIWDAFMEEALKGTPSETFKQPDAEQPPSKPMLNGNYVWTRVTETPQEQKEYQEIKEVHSILYYIDVDNPLGPAPGDPTRDPQFEAWEAPVREWAAKNGFSSGAGPYTPPTAGQKLFIKIVSPSPNQEILTPEFSVSILTVTTTSGIHRVEYFIDDQKIGTVQAPPFNFSGVFPDLPKTKHSLRVVVWDQDGNSASDSIQISNETMTKSQFIWLSPLLGQTIDRSPFPLTLSVTSDTKKVDYYFNDNIQSQWIGFQTEFVDSQSTFQWGSFPKTTGNYTLYAVITKTDGTLLKTQETTFTISQ